MGDPVSVGTELDRLHRPRPQWGLLGLTIALACVGALLRVWLANDDPAKVLLALILGSIRGHWRRERCLCACFPV